MKMNRTLMTFLTVSLMSLNLQANAATLLVGGYTQGTNEGLYRYAFDSRTGLIDPQALQVIKTPNPSWLVMSEDQRLLFAVNEVGDGQGSVSSFSLDERGVLAPLNGVPSLGDEPTHASLSQDQRFLLVANYSADHVPGGSLVAVPVGRDGTLAPVTQQHRHAPSQVDRERQLGPHVHSAVFSPDGLYLYASDLGADKVFIYHYDSANPGQPLRPAQPAAVSLPPGSGPRHLAFDATGEHAYLTLEMSGEVVMFDVADGQLVERQRLPLTPRHESEAKAAGGLHLSPDGRFLYVSNRGTSNEIVVFAVAPDTGQLKALQHRDSEGREPREFRIDPSGDFLLVANQKSDRIVVMKRDPRSGLLGKTVQVLEHGAPSDFAFVR